MGSEHFFKKWLEYQNTNGRVFYLTQSGSSDKPNPVSFFLLYKNCVVESDYDFAEEIAD